MREITITGNVVANAEMKTGRTNGQPYVLMKVANNEYKGKQDGQDIYDTHFYMVVCFNKRELSLVKYFLKGSRVIVSGDYSDSIYTNPANGKVYIDRQVVAHKIWFNSEGKKNNGETSANGTSETSTVSVQRQNNNEIKNIQVNIPKEQETVQSVSNDYDDLPF